MTEFEIADHGLVADEVSNIFAFIRRLPNHHKCFFPKPLYNSSEEFTPKLIYKGFYLGYQRIPGERWIE